VAHPFCDDLPSWVKRVQAVAYVRELETITIWEVMVICRSGTVGRFPSVVWAGPAETWRFGSGADCCDVQWGQCWTRMDRGRTAEMRLVTRRCGTAMLLEYLVKMVKSM
jgi:hypothetical protein